MPIPKTVIEFVDSAPSNGNSPVAHKAKELRINGVPVLVEADSVHLEYGPNEVTKLTVTILPTEIHFNHDHTSPRES